MTSITQSWQSYESKAEHYIALQQEVYLGDIELHADAAPWSYVIDIENSGGDLRSLLIRACLPSGLTFRWWVNLVDADGRTFQLQILTTLVSLLEPEIRGKLSVLLAPSLLEMTRRAERLENEALAYRSELNSIKAVLEGV